jgi:hypothetical protein
LLCNYFHATFFPFSTGYALHLQIILMRVVWQSYGIVFSTTIWHTMKKVRQLQFDYGNSKIFSCLPIWWLQLNSVLSHVHWPIFRLNVFSHLNN